MATSTSVSIMYMIRSPNCRQFAVATDSNPGLIKMLYTQAQSISSVDLVDHLPIQSGDDFFRIGATNIAEMCCHWVDKKDAFPWRALLAIHLEFYMETFWGKP